jgi:hypothetical protein
MMNERIKELAGQAKFMAEESINKQISANAELNAFAEKFAELIIKECLGDHKELIAARYQGSDYDRAVAYGMEIVYYDIVEKFGVES